jgi:hypothetical protein
MIASFATSQNPLKKPQILRENFFSDHQIKKIAPTNCYIKRGILSFLHLLVNDNHLVKFIEEH